MEWHGKRQKDHSSAQCIERRHSRLVGGLPKGTKVFSVQNVLFVFKFEY